MSNFLERVESLVQREERKLPPVHKWNPAFSGELDMRIAQDGRWFYLGSEVKRQSLCDLFSSILKKEDGQYYLVTPVEKWLIEVEDAPFVVTEFSRRTADEASAETTQDQLVFITANGDRVVASDAHPLWMEQKQGGAVRKPYLMVRDNMPGLIHRNIYYRLADLAITQGNEGAPGVWSCGKFFPLS